MKDLLAWLENLKPSTQSRKPSTRRSTRMADKHTDPEPTLQPATDDDPATESTGLFPDPDDPGHTVPRSAAMDLWTPPPYEGELTLKSAVLNVEPEAQNWPLLFRDSMGRLHRVKEVVVAPRPAMVILEANSLS